MLYTFSITSNESENFKVLITAHHSIKMIELHQAIQKALDYDPLQMASFFICDQEWQKQEEICLMQMEENNGSKLMENTSLVDIITDEEQNILYLFDFFSERYYFISLISTDDVAESSFLIDVSGTVPPQIVLESGNLSDAFLEDDFDEDDFSSSVGFENIDDLEDY